MEQAKRAAEASRNDYFVSAAHATRMVSVDGRDSASILNYNSNTLLVPAKYCVSVAAPEKSGQLAEELVARMLAALMQC